MLKHLCTSWKKSRGNLLIGLGSLAGLLMCCVWYFQLLPEVQFVPRNAGTPRAVAARSSPNYLVAIVRTPSLNTKSNPNIVLPLRCSVEILTSSEVLQQDYIPLLTQTTLIGANGGAKAMVFAGDFPRELTVLAYLDLNDNGKLDFDESNRATEPHRLYQNHAVESVVGEQQDKNSAQTSEHLTLPETTTAESAILVEVDFR